MGDEHNERSGIEQRVARLFALVCEALTGATAALLTSDAAAAQRIVEADQEIDELTDEISSMVWEQLDSFPRSKADLHWLVNVLLIVPEIERSGDLAENIARRTALNLGLEMNPATRGAVERMGEIASEMWQAVTTAYREDSAVQVAMHEADEEIDILQHRLTREIEFGVMPINVASEVTLIARFYERLGDHAVNLARRIAGSSR